MRTFKDVILKMIEEAELSVKTESASTENKIMGHACDVNYNLSVLNMNDLFLKQLNSLKKKTMHTTMNYKGLQEKYGKPKKKKKQKTLTNEKYKLGKSYFTASEWESFENWKKEQKRKEKAQERSEKKKHKTTKKKSKIEEQPLDKNKFRKQYKDPRWLEKRKEVLDAKGYTCIRCERHDNLQVHHLTYICENGIWRKPWDYPLDNFVVLCEKCHKEVSQDITNPLHEKYIRK